MAVAGVHYPTRQSTAITIICCWQCSDGCCRCSRPDSQPASPLFAVDNVQMAVAGVHDPTVNRHHHYLLLTMFRWLLPVFTTRQSTAITTHFPGFRRISIDDMRKTQVRLSQTKIKNNSVADPNPYDLYVFGPPGSVNGSISTR
jgi:hypothetical protein